MIYSGFVIRNERLLRNWSQEGLCKGICAVSYLSKIEQGKTEASDEILFALFCRLGIKWLYDAAELEKGGVFIEEWYDVFLSADWKKLPIFLKKAEKDFSALENSPLAVDFMVLKKLSENKTDPLDQRLEPCMSTRALAFQKLLCMDFANAQKLLPCAYTFLCSGIDAYEKGENSFAIELLEKAYSLGAEEGRARLMLEAKTFISSCYSNIGDIAAMERHGKIAKRLALALGEKEYSETVEYNFAATKIENGDFEGAYEYFSKLGSPSAFSLHKLAVCCEKLGKKEEAFAALEKASLSDDADGEYKIFVEKACNLVRFRLKNRDYLSSDEYGKLLFELFDLCREKFPAGYAKFHLPPVLEWYSAHRQYKQAFELVNNFSKNKSCHTEENNV